MLKWLGTDPSLSLTGPDGMNRHTMASELRSDVELQLSFLPNEMLVWQEGPAIGTGRFGHVVLALRVPSAELLAVKQIFIQEEFEQGSDTSSLCMQRVLPLAKIHREVEIVQSLQHLNIVQCLGCERYGPMYRIFMEYIPAGSLSRLLKDLGPFPESAGRHFVRQLTEGVAYLHHMGIAHRDLKCANLLLTNDGTVKIADFGTASYTSTTETRDCTDGDEFGDKCETARSVRDGLGSPYWMAPELVRAERGIDGWCKADVWGIGCVLIELITSKPPWDNHSNPLTAMFHIASKEAIPFIPSTLSANARSFLLCCFNKDPETRSSAAELLTHPFLTGEGGGLGRWPSKQHSVDTKDDVDNNHESDSIAHGNEEQPLKRSGSSLSSSSERSGSASESPSSRDSVISHGSSMAAEEDAIVYSSDDASDTESATAASQVPLEVTDPSILSHPSEQRNLGCVRALANYTAGDTSELSLQEGQTLIVVGVNEFGWWRGRHAPHEAMEAPATSDLGWFPCTYVEWIPGPDLFTVKRGHSVEDGAQNLLFFSAGDSVDVILCEWREEQLLAFGTLVSSGRQGWFPFTCLVNDSSSS